MQRDIKWVVLPIERDINGDVTHRESMQGYQKQIPPTTYRRTVGVSKKISLTAYGESIHVWILKNILKMGIIKGSPNQTTVKN